MTDKQHDSDSTVNRRNVLKKAGAAATAGVGFVGAASAGGKDGGKKKVRARFCGCGRVCVCAPSKDVEALVFHPQRGFRTDSIPSETCYTARQGRIVGLIVDGKLVCNPNECARRPLEEM